jgi:hypothetical protein
MEDVMGKVVTLCESKGGINERNQPGLKRTTDEYELTRKRMKCYQKINGICRRNRCWWTKSQDDICSINAC